MHLSCDFLLERGRERDREREREREREGEREGERERETGSTDLVALSGVFLPKMRFTSSPDFYYVFSSIKKECQVPAPTSSSSAKKLCASCHRRHHQTILSARWGTKNQQERGPGRSGSQSSRRSPARRLHQTKTFKQRRRWRRRLNHVSSSTFEESSCKARQPEPRLHRTRNQDPVQRRRKHPAARHVPRDYVQERGAARQDPRVHFTRWHVRRRVTAVLRGTSSPWSCSEISSCRHRRRTGRYGRRGDQGRD